MKTYGERMLLNLSKFSYHWLEIFRSFYSLVFSPDRWRNIHSRDSTKQGIYNLMTFGLGPHSCLGHWFAVAEIKIFIAALLPHFEFSPVEGIKISKFNSILTRPFVSGKWSAGTQLPLVVREVK